MKKEREMKKVGNKGEEGELGGRRERGIGRGGDRRWKIRRRPDGE